MIGVAIFILAIVAFMCFVLSAESNECPRQILGYRCRRGNPNYPEGCDHSALEVARAKTTVHKGRFL